MKFGRQGITLLLLLAVAALVLSFASSVIFEGVRALATDRTQTSADWRLVAKGVVESRNEVVISSQIKGMVKEVMVDEGERVESNQPIVSFADAKIKAQLQLAEAVLRQAQAYLAQLESGYRHQDIDAARRAFESKQAIFLEARNEAERMEQLFKTGAVTETARDNANRDYNVALAGMREAAANLDKLRKGPRKEEIASAKADTDRASAELEYMQATWQDYSITSPIAGLVVERTAEVGETVDVGTRLFYIVDPDSLRIWAEIEETDAGKVSAGQDVIVEVDAFPDKKFRGKVTQVIKAVQRKRQKSFDPVASFDINTQKVLIELDDYAGLVHGLTVTVLFTK